MATIFTTERLIVRDWQPAADAEQALIMHSDPEVMRFIGGRKIVESIAVQREQLQQYIERYQDLPGLGFWAIELREGGLVAGAVILKPLPDAQGTFTDDIEVGWRLRRDCWGKGYATEAGQGALVHGFGILGLPVIYAVTNLVNEASQKVALRLGMEPQGHTDRYYGEELKLFKKIVPPSALSEVQCEPDIDPLHPGS